MSWPERREKMRHALRRAIDKLRDLDLGKLRHRLRAAKNQRSRKQKARAEAIRRRDRKREVLQDLLAKPKLTPDEQRKARELEIEITRLDHEAEELHTVISRRTQLIRRLKPKNRARTRQQKDLNERIRDRRRKLRRAIRRHRRDNIPSGDGVVTFDGKPCAAWIARDLAEIRRRGWRGTMISGFRTPAASEAICQAYCGRPTCTSPPCAGAGSEHSQYIQPRGAADLSLFDLANALRLLREIGSTLHNALGASDPNHVSTSGR